MSEETPERQFYRELQEHNSYYSYHETENLLLSFAKEYAQIVIKCLFTANGGALFLLPPILGILKTKDMDSFYLAAGFYSVGICASVVAAISAYYSTTFAFKTYRSLIDIDYKSLQIKRLTNVLSPSWKEQVTKEKEKSEVSLKNQNFWCEFWSHFGVVLAIISLICFIIGTLSFLANV